jgi:hypothetical protein
MYLFLLFAVNFASLAFANPLYFKLPLIYYRNASNESSIYPTNLVLRGNVINKDPPGPTIPRELLPRGCGTVMGYIKNYGEVLIGDGECHETGYDIDVMHVGGGCDCVTFDSVRCGVSEPKHWTSWIRGPTGNKPGKLPYHGSLWYACSDDREFGKV